MKRTVHRAFLASLLATVACGRTALGTLTEADRRDGSGTSYIPLPDGSLFDLARHKDGTDAGADAICQWTFAPQANYVVDQYPVALAVGDFTGDGLPDVLTTTASDKMVDGKVNLLANLGDGRLATPVALDVGLTPYASAVADFDVDGKPDLAIIYEYQATGASPLLDIFLNQGEGSLRDSASYAINGGGFDLASGDFNRDGYRDLALVDAKVNITVLLNRGDGTFASPATFYAGGAAFLLTVGDLNRDGAPDIVVAATFSVTVLINAGDGTFPTRVTYDNSSACDDVGPITVGDFNGDGYPDVARSCYQGKAAVGVRINQGDGTLGPEIAYSAGSWPWQVAVEDFTGDGKSDLAVANSSAYFNTVSILPGKGDGTFGAQVVYPAVLPRIMATGDLNRDGHSDLVTAGNNTISVLLSVCR